MAKLPKMLPCPFCGKTYTGNDIIGCYGDSRFECPFCGAMGPFPDLKGLRLRAGKEPDDKLARKRDAEAIKVWNRRSCP